MERLYRLIVDDDGLALLREVFGIEPTRGIERNGFSESVLQLPLETDLSVETMRLVPSIDKPTAILAGI